MRLPKGFRYAAAYAGIRKTSNDDVALIVSDQPAAAAAVFTTNRVVAAPVDVARKNLRASRGRVRAVLINAGNANCATRTGERVARECVEAVARAIGSKPREVLPASTGVIGVELDGDLIMGAIPKLVAGLGEAKFEEAARAMLTTDTRIKIAGAKVGGPGGAVMAGMTKAPE
jgi:glutamate N-acetyltransferase/amino-acid N-acetyltransferase